MNISRLKISILAACISTSLIALSAQAANLNPVDDWDLFEVDGDATESLSYDGLDWQTLNGLTPPSPGAAFGDNCTFITATGAVPDPTDSTDQTFTGGRTDLQQTSSPQVTQGPGNIWGWTTGTSPDKDELENAYAAAYDCGGDLVVYFGADRIATDGAANLGFWFLQQDVAPVVGGRFSGRHVNGDTLILVNYENGGTVPNIGVYRWCDESVTNDPNCQADVKDGNTAVVQTIVDPSTTAVKCTNAGNHDYCAITNDNAIPLYWPYTPKGGSLNDPAPSRAFFEGGINLTNVLGQSLCVTAFVAETRSSPSITASLKDFVTGNFNVCGLDVSKSCPDSRVGATLSGLCETTDTQSCTTSADCPVIPGSAVHEACDKTNPQFVGGNEYKTQYLIPITTSGPVALTHVKVAEVEVQPTTSNTISCRIVDIDGTPQNTALAIDGTLPYTYVEVKASLSGTTNVTVECTSTKALTTNKVSAIANVGATATLTDPKEFTFNPVVDGTNTCLATPTPGLKVEKACGYDGTCSNNSAIQCDQNSDCGAGNTCVGAYEDVKLKLVSSALKFEVPVTIAVSNTGDENLTNIVLSDDPAISGLGPIASLAKGASTVFKKTYQTTTPDGLASEWIGCDVSFSDTVTLTSATGVSSGTFAPEGPSNEASATCFFCPTDGCDRTP